MNPLTAISFLTAAISLALVDERFRFPFRAILQRCAACLILLFGIARIADASFGTFLNDTSSKKITARDLVKAGIAANQLAPETQNDLKYLHAIDVQLVGRQL